MTSLETSNRSFNPHILNNFIMSSTHSDKRIFLLLLFYILHPMFQACFLILSEILQPHTSTEKTKAWTTTTLNQINLNLHHFGCIECQKYNISTNLKSRPTIYILPFVDGTLISTYLKLCATLCWFSLVCKKRACVLVHMLSLP